MMSSWAAMLLTLALIAMVFGVLRLWQRRQPAPAAETVRKAAHMLTGAIAACFPWIFHATWPGVALCLLALLGMIVVRLVPALRHGVGRVTGSVERDSWGEFYFPIAVACVWVWSERHPVLYVVPVLLLTFGDAAAALIGLAHGRHKFRTTEGSKSIEGSLAFLLVGFASTLAVLALLIPDASLARLALNSLLLSSLLMVFEAISWRGLDNLLLPVLGFLFLRIHLDLDAPQLAARIGVFSSILLLLIAIKRRRTLIGEGVLAATIFLYGAWALGGWTWLTPPAIVVLAAPWLPRHARVPSVQVHGVFPVLALSAPGLALLLAHVLTSWDAWPAYVAAMAAALAIVVCVQLHPDLAQPPGTKLLATSVTLGTLLVVAPSIAVAAVPLHGAAPLLAAAATAALLSCALAFVPALNRLSGERWMWPLRGVALCCASATAGALYYLLHPSTLLGSA